MARGLIARAWLGATGGDSRLGGFTLRPSQTETVARIEQAFVTFGGALLADPPGTGKTLVALAVARRFERALVVAPAALCSHWEEMSARASVRIEFTSHERLSNGHAPPRAPLVIVDEAHHARTPRTARYRALAALTAGARVLLLTATPVVNRQADRNALLALFLGADPPTTETLSHCIISRQRDDAVRPTLRRLPDLRGDAEVPGLAATLERLPPPQPINGGSAATALIRISLAFAWHSSLAALDAALRRRVQRGEALRDLISAGRTPSRDALRYWTISDDDTQLAMPELIGAAVAANGAVHLETLDAHLSAVRELRRLIGPRIEADSRARRDAIRSLAVAYPRTRIVLLSRHAETVRALHRQLRADPGVLAVTGQAVHATVGRWTRREVLAAIGPRARPLDPADHRAIRILLATDLLSEGVEMQGIGIVVHADLPWTPARLAQRRGRIIRVGSSAREVIETRFAIPEGAEPLLRLGRLLARKRHSAARSLRVALDRDALDETMREWAILQPGERIAAADAPFRGLVAAVRVGSEVVIAAGRAPAEPAVGWTMTTSPSECARICRAASAVESVADHVDVRVARRLLRRFFMRRAAQGALGASSSGARGARQRLLTRFDALLASATPAQRTPLASLQRDLLDRLGDRVEIGLERELANLLRVWRPEVDLVLAASALLDRIRPAAVAGRSDRSAKPRLIALLLLRPAAPRDAAAPPADARSSAVPGTAAPR